MMKFFRKKVSAAKDGKVDAETHDAILQDPEVKEAMKNAGDNALSDPKVQGAIAKCAKENLSAENAQLIADNAKEWANDPEVQAKARHYAGMAMVSAGQAGQAFVGCIEQGPGGVRFMAFLAGVASCVFAALEMMGCASQFKVAHLAYAVYQVLFALTTMLFEAETEWIAKVGPASVYQDKLIEHAKFLTMVGGRGLFYIFQGVMWVVLVDFGNLNVLNPFQPNFWHFGIGLFMMFIGILHVLMHFGIMPQHLAAKAKEAATTAVTTANQYRPVASDSA